MVFLHGLSADHTLFDKQVAHFAARCTLILWDAPAHALSRPYEDFSYANLAKDLKEILDAEGISKAVFVGQSMGGYVTQAFIKRYPEYVSAFIGIDTCPFGEKYYSRSDMWWLRQIEWMYRLFPHKLLTESVAKTCTRTEYAQDNMRKALAFYSKDELCRLTGRGYTAFLEENSAMKIACPVLIIVGRQDRTGKVLQYCREWQRSEGYELVYIENAAHNSNADNPDAVNAAIDVFLKDLY